MKKTAKIVAVALAIVLALSLSVVAFAATVTPAAGAATGSASITVNTPEDKGEAANNTYKIYKVFDAQVDPTTGNIIYSTTKGSVPAGFTKDANGQVTYTGEATGTELTEADIRAIAAYVTNADLVATVETTAADDSFTVNNLPYGYYYITTTTGTLVTVTSTNPTATVDDKNDVPPVDKLITKANGGVVDVDAAGKKAMGEVGNVVEFTATVTKKAGAENYIFHDVMTSGLTYDPSTLTITDKNGTVAASSYSTAVSEGDTLSVRFYNDYINTLADGDVITIKYSATVNNNALVTDEENNTAYLSYGHEGSTNYTPKEEVEVFDANILVNKFYKDGNDQNQPLAGAGFVLKNADNKYYSVTDNGIVWVDSIDDATEYFTDATGALADGKKFSGLASGTYTLVEKTVPAGYNKGEDTTITVTANDYTTANLTQTADVENETGSVLPSTGGMGTVIFYVAGAILVVAAAAVLIAKKRTNATAA